MFSMFSPKYSGKSCTFAVQIRVMTATVIHNPAPEPTAQTCADGAVGVADTHWYVALTTRPNTERATAKTLADMGLDTYVATQSEMRLRAGGRRVVVERVVIPSVVFVRCTESRRRAIAALPGISRFLTNRAAATAPGLNKPPATVSPDELARLRFMLGASDRPVSFDRTYARGQNVRVVRGPLRGLTGTIVREPSGSSRLYISIALFGSAYMDIHPTEVEPLP